MCDPFFLSSLCLSLFGDTGHRLVLTGHGGVGRVDVLILRDNLLPDHNVNRIEAELLRAGFLCQQVAYSRVLIEVNGAIRFFVGGQEIEPKIVINWIMNRDLRAYELLKACEVAGLRVVNKAEAWRSAGSDFLTSLVMYQAEVVHPYAWHAPSGAAVLENQERLEYPLIHLPTGQIGSRSLVQIADKNALQARMKAFVRSQHNLDFQRARESEYLGLVRTIVLGGKAIVACSAGNPRSQPSTLREWWARRAKNRLALLALNDDFAAKAETAAEALGLDICCIEIYQYPDGWEVAGVNCCPNIKQIEDGFGINIAARFAKWVMEQIECTV